HQLRRRHSDPHAMGPAGAVRWRHRDGGCQILYPHPHHSQRGAGIQGGEGMSLSISGWPVGPVFFLFALCSNAASAQSVVLVSMAPVYELTEPLLAGTDVRLQLLPDEPRSMQAQATLFTRQAERFAASFAEADAVITTGKVWSADPLYTAAREVNIRVVNIDASKPWSHELDGVAVAN